MSELTPILLTQSQTLSSVDASIPYNIYFGHHSKQIKINGLPNNVEFYLLIDCQIRSKKSTHGILSFDDQLFNHFDASTNPIDFKKLHLNSEELKKFENIYNATLNLGKLNRLYIFFEETKTDSYVTSFPLSNIEVINEYYNLQYLNGNLLFSS